MTAIGSPQDPLYTLRKYRHLAPWNLRDMVAVASAILDSANVTPISAAATALPNERTIRFYVTRGLVTPPEGRGTAATYGYRHLLQVLGIKLRQMEGATLAQIETELGQTTGDVLERRVAAALGPGLPAPRALAMARLERPATGRAGRVLQTLPAESRASGLAAGVSGFTEETWHRIFVSRGVELHVSDRHPLASLSGRSTDVADAIRSTISQLLGRIQGAQPAGVAGPSEEPPN
jgi:DNA-binding transcriptional MerR regulator